MQPFYQALYDFNADLILIGHDHIYERFAPQTPTGDANSARGIRQFVIGSGGANHTAWGTIRANSQARNNDTFGVLNLDAQAHGLRMGVRTRGWQDVHRHRCRCLSRCQRPHHPA